MSRELVSALLQDKEAYGRWKVNGRHTRMSMGRKVQVQVQFQLPAGRPTVL